MAHTRRSWSAAEDRVLFEAYAVDGPAAVAARLVRPPESVRSRANRLGIRTRRYWTAAELARVRADYGRVATATLAAALGRTCVAVALKAVQLGVAERYGKRPEWTPELEARYVELHAAGYSDTEMVAILGGDRPWLNAHRRRLGLPSNRGSARYKARMQAHLRNQVERAGVASFAELRHRKARDLARRYGLPEDLRPREVEICLTLANGPATKSQICAALGLSWSPGRAGQKSLHASGGTSYLSALAGRGLVAKLRLPGSGGNQSRAEQNVYTLTAAAMDLLTKGGSDGAAE